MNSKDRQALMVALASDTELSAVFDVIPSNKTIMGYTEIGRKSGVTGKLLDDALEKLVSLHAIVKLTNGNNVLGDYDYYLRLP